MRGRQIVQDSLAAILRAHVYELPTAAPELNPAERIRTQADEYDEHIAGAALKNTDELDCNAHAALMRTRNNARRLRACLKQSSLPW
jgi:hypothetical protein